MTESLSSFCPACGTALSDESPGGLCPACLMRQAMQPTAGGPPETETPGLSAVAAAFPQWEVLSLLGRGGMGAVFKIRQPKLNRLAALKIIPASLAERDSAFAGRFEREGELLARLHHPNIVNVHDSGRSGDFYYLLMEHVDGVNLRQAMLARRFTPEQALAVVPKICEALQYAHEEGVLHRDIKPENILLDSKGRVKLADFGIAKLMGSAAANGASVSDRNNEVNDSGTNAETEAGNGDDGSLTKLGSALGTPRYMAPEQAVFPREVDHRADIYSLGVVFYELLTGQLPTAAAFSPPSAYAAVDHRVDDIVRQALEKERELRQRSAGEMKTQVETLAGGFSTAEINAAVAQLRRSFEYKSKRVIFGLPLLHVVYGYDPLTRKPKPARGIFAFGGSARGFVAFGGRARGFFAFGGIATGVVAFGGIACGLLTFGGLSIALGLAVGGLAVGPFATGGVALGWNAVGGLAIGWQAAGGLVIAHLGIGGRVIATHIAHARDAVPGGLRAMMSLSPMVAFSGVLWVIPFLIGMIVPLWARKQPRAQHSPSLPSAPGFSATGPSDRRPRMGLRIALLALPLLALLILAPFFNSKNLARLTTGNLTPQPPAQGSRVVWPREPSEPRPPDKAFARLSYEKTKARHEAGMASQQEMLDAKHRLDLAEAAGDPAKTAAANLEWAKSRFEVLEAQYKAGIASQQDLLDARHDLDLALATGDRIKAAVIQVDWATKRLSLVEALHKAGNLPDIEVEKAKLELDILTDQQRKLEEESK